MHWKALDQKQVFCQSCGAKLTDLDLRFARYSGHLCTECREKEWERQLKAMGYFPSLDEAVQSPDSHLIITGDDGAICYLVYPASLVKCDAEKLELLAHDLEEAISPGDSSGAHVRYRRVTLNEEVDSFAVGEDAGIASGKLWLPKWLIEAGLDQRIQQILDGEGKSLDLSLAEQTTVQLLHKEYHARKFEEDIT